MSEYTNIVPNVGMCIIKKDVGEEKSSGGILLASSPDKINGYAMGTVMNVGDARRANGSMTHMSISIGQRVAFNPSSGTKVKFKGEELHVLRCEDIIFALM